MSTAALVDQELPYLRRYARAATGDRSIGDKCVEYVLQDMLELELIGHFSDVSLDKAFIFKTLDEKLANVFGNDEGERARRALLLTAMESFDTKTAAEILGTDAETFSFLISTAEQDLVKALATRLLIIEDEPVIGVHLKQIAESVGHTVIGIAVRASDAVEIYAKQKPDIILADIQLADGSLGTDAIADMALPETVPVVFITAFPEQMLRTNEDGPTYLITKPFQPDYVRAVISHALIRADRKKADIAAAD